MARTAKNATTVRGNKKLAKNIVSKKAAKKTRTVKGAGLLAKKKTTGRRISASASVR